MAFGRRETGVAFSTDTMTSRRSRLSRRGSGAIVVRRGGYWAGLLGAAVGFVGSAILTVAYAFATSGAGNLTPGGVLLLISVKVALPAMLTYAISLGLVDALLRIVRLGGRTPYAVLCPIIPALLLIAPAWAARPIPQTLYLLPLILPGAIVGGLVLGGFRRRA